MGAITEFFEEIYLLIKFFIVSISYLAKAKKKEYYNTLLDLKDINGIDVKILKKKGINTIISDWEYTLAGPNSYEVGENIIKKFDELKKTFRIIILTNNHTLRKSISEKYGLETVDVSAMKPQYNAFDDTIKNTGVDKNKAVFLGDSWFCDILGANNFGLPAIHVAPLVPERNTIRGKMTTIFRNIELNMKMRAK